MGCMAAEMKSNPLPEKNRKIEVDPFCPCKWLSKCSLEIPRRSTLPNGTNISSCRFFQSYFGIVLFLKKLQMKAEEGYALKDTFDKKSAPCHFALPR